MQNRWSIILFATLFNVLFEYSLRGINNLPSQPGLPIILFTIYFTLFTMIEDLIVRFKLKASHLMILSFFYGTIYVAWTSGAAFINPTFLGINWGTVLYVNIVWWGVIQAVLTFYLANRFFPRDWNHSRLSVGGWITCLLVNFFTAVILFQLSGLIPQGIPIARLTILAILAVNFIVLVTSIKKNSTEIPKFVKSKFLDFLSLLTVIVFLFSAVFFTKDPILSGTSNVNQTSLRVISLYTLGVSIAVGGYKLIKKEPISV